MRQRSQTVRNWFKWLRLIWLAMVVGVLALVAWQWRPAEAPPDFTEQLEQSLRLVPEVDSDATDAVNMIGPVTDESVPVAPTNERTVVVAVQEVPFTSQAPQAQWDDDRFQDGCEEASALMAMSWVNNQALDAERARQEIVAMSDYQLATYGNYHDTNAADTAQRLFREYFNHEAVRVDYDITIADIKRELAKNQLVLVPTDGRLLANPYYTAPGPSTHMLVLRGYDPQREEFITNDPGTKRGQGYRYNTAVVWEAILDYPTGNHEPVVEQRKAMIVVWR